MLSFARQMITVSAAASATTVAVADLGSTGINLWVVLATVAFFGPLGIFVSVLLPTRVPVSTSALDRYPADLVALAERRRKRAILGTWTLAAAVLLAATVLALS
ncbi:hypothetical protein GCM10025865_14200 [Paraoerskovia sediminicola]|uniref:Uncharacterized protein n=1 Tax=Paraoerskovia sediminicola TaxID=1138587 RepID=A0ABN6XET5_9CELL|nr:hypothetical protein [Paraoerskovia sediminicola]BDZ42121.1 hypothetical protein GCM10025865_14200 [Paraoerskovia sediminicola]